MLPGIFVYVGLLVIAFVSAFFAVYWFGRAVVRDGVLDALRLHEAERVRSRAGLGPERSPNSGLRG